MIETSPRRMTIMIDIREMSRALWSLLGFVSVILSDESAYISPVSAKGMSIVLLTMKLCFSRIWLAMRAVDPK